MNDRYEDDRQLRDALRALPRSRAPQRDLWPGIEGRLSNEVSSTTTHAPRRVAIVAGIAVAFLVGILAGRGLDGESPAPQAAPGQVPDPALVAMIEGMEREYRAAFRAFAPVGVGQAALLQPPAVEEIEATWNELQQAEAALKAALAEHPGNAFLGEKLHDLRARQLAFMRQIHMLDQNSRRET